MRVSALHTLQGGPERNQVPNCRYIVLNRRL